MFRLFCFYAVFNIKYRLKCVSLQRQKKENMEEDLDSVLLRSMLDESHREQQKKLKREQKEMSSFEWQKVGGIAGIVAAVASVLGLVWMVLTHYGLI